VTGVATTFDAVLSYGDDCPVCGRAVKSTVEGGNGTRAYNSECSQFDTDNARVRYIFHQEGPK